MRRFLSYCLTVVRVVEVPARGAEVTPEGRVLDAAKRCWERWGMAKVTVDDIAAEAGISRATLYRLFPGGKDVLYEALRRRETAAFFAELDEHIARAESFEGLLVCIVVEATRQLRSDEHLQTMLASRPGDVAADLTVDGLPVIVENATVDRRGARRRARRVPQPVRRLLLPRPLRVRRSR
jgi:AcrR family transcriptional regulator